MSHYNLAELSLMGFGPSLTTAPPLFFFSVRLLAAAVSNQRTARGKTPAPCGNVPQTQLGATQRTVSADSLDS